MSPRSLPLNAIDAFLVTARHLNLTHAAKELCLTQGAVSRKIGALESWLGFALFDRHARGLRLTPRGAALLPQLKQGYDLMLNAAEQAHDAGGALRLRAPTCAMRWLLPKLVQLEQQHPDLHVTLTTTLCHSQQLGNFDAAILYGPPMTGAHLLFAERITPVIAQSLLPGGGPLRISDLAGFTFLHPSEGDRDWRLWLQAQDATLPMRRNQHFSTMDLATGAAIEGFGVTVADVTLVESDLAARRLVAPFAASVATGAVYSLISRTEKETPPHLATLVAWLCQAV